MRDPGVAQPVLDAIRTRIRERYTVDEAAAARAEAGDPHARRVRAFACGIASVCHVPLYAGGKHSTAAELFRRGIDRARIQAARGHADARSTDAYVVLVGPLGAVFYFDRSSSHDPTQVSDNLSRGEISMTVDVSPARSGIGARARPATA